MRITRLLAAAALPLAVLLAAPGMAATPKAKASSSSGDSSICSTVNKAVQSVGTKIGCSDKSKTGDKKQGASAAPKGAKPADKKPAGSKPPRPTLL